MRKRPTAVMPWEEPAMIDIAMRFVSIRAFLAWALGL